MKSRGRMAIGSSKLQLTHGSDPFPLNPEYGLIRVSVLGVVVEVYTLLNAFLVPNFSVFHGE